MAPYQPSNSAKAHRGLSARRISRAETSVAKRRPDACDGRRLVIPTRKPLIFEEIASWAVRSAFALDREHHLLAVLAYADDDEERDRGRFAVEPHAHHGAVENEPHDRLFGQRAGVPRVPIALHLAPGPAHRVLAHRAAKQGGERMAHPAGVSGSQIGA